MAFEIKSHIVVKDGKIILTPMTGLPKKSRDEEYLAMVVASIENEHIEGYDEIIEVPVEATIEKGSDVREYTKDWKRRPLKDRVADGLVTPPEGQTVDKETDKFRPMTGKEKVAAGDVVLEPWQKIDDATEEIIQKAWSERTDSGAYEQWLNQVVRPERNRRLTEADVVYCNPERWYSYSDAEKSAWSTYKQELRDFPAVKLTVVDDPKELPWPSLPKPQNDV